MGSLCHEDILLPWRPHYATRTYFCLGALTTPRGHLSASAPSLRHEDVFLPHCATRTSCCLGALTTPRGHISASAPSLRHEDIFLPRRPHYATRTSFCLGALTTPRGRFSASAPSLRHEDIILPAPLGNRSSCMPAFLPRRPHCATRSQSYTSDWSVITPSSRSSYSPSSSST